MATIDPAQKFAEQAARVDRIVRESGALGDPGRIILVLAMANVAGGVHQKQVLEGMALPKDVLSKLVTSLVANGLLTQERDASNPRMKRLMTSDAGRKLLSRVRALLQPSRTTSKRKPKGADSYSFFEPEQE